MHKTINEDITNPILYMEHIRSIRNEKLTQNNHTSFLSPAAIDFRERYLDSNYLDDICDNFYKYFPDDEDNENDLTNIEFQVSTINSLTEFLSFSPNDDIIKQEIFKKRLENSYIQLTGNQIDQKLIELFFESTGEIWESVIKCIHAFITHSDSKYLSAFFEHPDFLEQSMN